MATTGATPVTARSMVQGASRAWWLFLITGIAWLLIALVVLRFDITSIASVGVLLGVLFLAAGVNELLTAAARRSWRWAHILLGVLFLIGGLWCFITPVNAFWNLAAVLGFLLVLKGTLDLVGSVATRGVNEVWWLGMIAGILEILLGFWASQQFSPPRA